MRLSRQKYIRIPLLLVMMLSYFIVANNSLSNKHIHVLPNGIVLEHAHPLMNSDQVPSNDSHNHTKAELIFFGTIGSLEAAIIATLVALFVWLMPQIRHYVVHVTKEIPTIYLFRENGRAPPYFA